MYATGRKIKTNAIAAAIKRQAEFPKHAKVTRSHLLVVHAI